MAMFGGGSGDVFSPERPDILLATETEAFVQNMKPSSFQELGSMSWIEKHHIVEKLTAQAIVEALSKREEFVKEMLVTYEKLTVLVHDAILVELWREEILPVLLQLKSARKTPQIPCSFTIYTILFHEAACINLIETVLYHPEIAEILGDDSLDLIDYCIRATNNLIMKLDKDKSMLNYWEPVEEDVINLKVHGEGEVETKSDVLLFRIGFKCLTILRYIIENIEKINSAVVPRLINSSDTPMLLVELLLKKPWRRTNSKGIEQVYSDEQAGWIGIKPNESLIAGKIEGQVWLAIYQIFLNPRVLSNYEIHTYRKTQLVRLTGLLNDVLLDQLPVLAEFRGWLHELSIGTHFCPSKSPLVLEMLPQYRTALAQELDDKREIIIEIHKSELVTSSSDELTAKAKKLASVYDFDIFESALPPSKCAECGQPALQRCSRCHFEYYCQRTCQVAHWPQHKEFCDKMMSKEYNEN